MLSLTADSPPVVRDLGLVARFRWAVRTDAEAAGFSPMAVGWLLWAPVVLGVMVASTVVNRALFVWILRDDHPIEWAQFGLVFGASIVAAMAAYRLARQRRPGLAFVFVLFALGSFMLAGEEISWGQRVLAIATPASLGTLNTQKELNIHDISAGGLPIEQAFEFVELLLALGGTVLPLIVRLRSPGRGDGVPPGPFGGLWRALSPALVLVPGFAVMFAYRFVRTFVLPRSYDAIVGYQEYVELWFYFGLAMLAICNYSQTRLRRLGRHVLGGGQGAGSRVQVFSLPVIVVAAISTAVTIVLALLTMLSGALPG